MTKTALIAMAMGLIPAAAVASDVRVFPQEGLVQGATTLVCEDARENIDAGMGAQLIENENSKFLVLSEETFAGPRSIGIASVHAVIQKMQSDRQMLIGSEIEFVVDTASVDLHGRMKAFVRGTLNGVRLDNDLLCRAPQNADRAAHVATPDPR
jgi:hypothetical protein